MMPKIRYDMPTLNNEPITKLSTNSNIIYIEWHDSNLKYLYRLYK